MSDFVWLFLLIGPVVFLFMVAVAANDEYDAKIKHRKEQLRLQRRANNLAARAMQDRKERKAKQENDILEMAAESFRQSQRRFQAEAASPPDRSLRTTPVRPISPAHYIEENEND